MTVDVVAQEFERRLTAWRELLEMDGPADVERPVIRQLVMYGGAQGVWVDASRMRALTAHGTGIAVGLLHMGRHYADDLSESGSSITTTHRPSWRPRCRRSGGD